MRVYLEQKIGRRLSVIRAGMPREVYFEAVLRSVDDEVAIFEDEEGREIALALDKVLVIGQPEQTDPGRTPVGFGRKKDNGPAQEPPPGRDRKK